MGCGSVLSLDDDLFVALSLSTSNIETSFSVSGNFCMAHARMAIPYTISAMGWNHVRLRIQYIIFSQCSAGYKFFPFIPSYNSPVLHRFNQFVMTYRKCTSRGLYHESSCTSYKNNKCCNSNSARCGASALSDFIQAFIAIANVCPVGLFCTCVAFSRARCNKFSTIYGANCHAELAHDSMASCRLNIRG